MPGEYSVGTALLSIVPDFTGVQRAAAREAAAAGAIFEQQLRRSVQNGLQGGFRGNGPTADATRQGAQLGGALGGAIQARLQAALRNLPKIDVDANTSPAQAEIQRIRAEIETLAGKRIGVDLDASAALAEADRLAQQLRELGRNNPDIQVRTDAAAAAGALAEVQRQADRLNGQRVRLDVDSANLDSFSGRLQLLGTLIGSLLPALVPLGGAAVVGLGAIGVAATTSLPAVGALALGLSGVGDALKAMGKVDDEAAQVGAKNAQARVAQAKAETVAAEQVKSTEASLANTRAQAAQSAKSSARDIVDAQGDVVKAERAAAEQATQTARRVQDSQESLKRAQDDAADSAEAAARRVADAQKSAQAAAVQAATRIQSALEGQQRSERNLADAQRAAKDAQDALTGARKSAAEQLEDLQTRVEDNALAQRQALLDAQQARADLAKTNADSTSTAMDKQQAKLRYDQAVQGLKEVGIESQRLAAQQAEADAKGVEGSDAVRAAQQKITDTVVARQDAEKAAGEASVAVDQARADGVERVASAQQSLTDAQKAQAKDAQASAQSIAAAQQAVTDAVAAQVKAQTDGAESIATAQRKVLDAQEASANQARSSAFSIAQAQDALTKARQSQADAATSSTVAASAATSALALAMGNLSPAGREFAAFLYGLKPQLDSLKSAAASGLLPGLQDGIKALLPLMPTFESILKSTGGALGDLARQAGRALAGPEWKPFFDFLKANAAPILTSFGQIIGALASALPGLAVAFQPLIGPLLQGLLAFSTRFAAFATGLSQNPAFQAFIAYVQANMPLVLSVIGSLADLFVTLLKAMAPFGPVILQIIGFLARFLANLPPEVLGAIGAAVVAISGAFALLGPVIGPIVGIVAAMTGPAGLGLLGAVLGALGGPIGLIILAVGALVAAFVTAYAQSESFRDGVNAAVGAVRDFIVSAWNDYLLPALRAFGDFLTGTVAPAVQWFWKNVVEPAFAGIGNAAKWSWENVIRPAMQALVWFFQKVVAPVVTWLWQNVAKPAFEAIGFLAQVAWAVIKLAFDALIFFLQRVVAPALDWLWRKVFEPAMNGIGSAVSWAWDHVIHPALSALKDFFDSTLGPAIERGVSAFTTAWAKMKRAAADPINFVIREVYGGTDDKKGIRGLFKKVAEAVGSDARLPALNEVAGYATGGRIGGYSPTRTADNIPIWATAGEFMQPVSTVDYYGTGIMEAMRRRAIPKEALQGLARGGTVQSLVGLGKQLQQMGLRVSENKFFGGVTPGAHTANGWHYKLGGAGAFDVNLGTGNPKGEKEALDKAIALANSKDFRTIWQANGHYDHAHVDLGAGPSIGSKGSGGILSSLLDGVEAIGGAAKDVFGDLWDGATSVMSPFTDLIGKMKSGVGSSPFAQLTQGAASKAFTSVTDWVRDKVNIFAGSGDTGRVGAYSGGQGGLSAADARAAGKQMMPGGWSWDALNKLWNQESGWRWDADNPSSSAYGIPQALPGKKMASAGSDWLTNAITQIHWGLDYIKGRYGNSQSAWAHEVAQGWYAQGGPITPTLYDQGGVLPPGYSTVLNATGKPEVVFTNEQARALVSVAQSVQSGGGGSFIGEQHNHITSGLDLQAWEQRQRIEYAAYKGL